MEKGVSGRRYILNGENLSLAALLSRIAAALDRPPVHRVLPRWTEGLLSAAARVAELGGAALTPQVVFFSYRYRWFSAARAQTELGWSPKAGLGAAIEDAIDWYAGRGVLERPRAKPRGGQHAVRSTGQRVA
jgi:dihydroflavonol-4-reductase